MRQQVAGHLQLGRVHVVDANLERLIVQILVDMIDRLLVVGLRLGAVDAVRVILIVIVVNDAVYFDIVVVAAAQKVSQIVRQTKQQLPVIAAVVLVGILLQRLLLNVGSFVV